MPMPSGTKHPSSRNKVREHRARLRAQGLRPIQIWAHRQSLAVAASPHAAEDQDIEAISGRPTE
jgi:hypothetical protein